MNVRLGKGKRCRIAHRGEKVPQVPSRSRRGATIPLWALISTACAAGDDDQAQCWAERPAPTSVGCVARTAYM
ncbi:uncharacterized protein SCHCODRAFT_02215040 [Schizophyllum commune H4-8]|uniref:uncharacterized protein n=1 Tax=Schizophyllum commune (strain H4-8 / FGSC 9210) TaxID=578458 RepID=UPI002160DFAD|nr:uncharacterized protein SCHCODRAFT_02215040 [Schizophyllum commune H4-8]KAI5894737.1 hypothetical protein SCHCODRAFT_02215040 [Schizophyllum commune H4-8]